MSQDSRTSSMRAQNGSAYSSETIHAATTAIGGRNTPPHRKHSFPSADAYNRRQPENTPAQADQSASPTRATLHHGPYDLPAYDHSTPPRYETELALEQLEGFEGFEEESIPDTTPSHISPPNNPAAQSHHTGSPENHSDQTQPSGVPLSPTTQRWSTSSSPEERLRLGLPRYANRDEERRAYQQAVCWLGFGG
ncbi:uncharacterized protein L3040_004974 [Drepanopeziza brunnea f. sp. 'multigermtubi']|uniref:uncharacterized protein n=1 Tax=Drepanopeziza brunnea f. sp. 'multigermtubi' TaxID=698441 RepID=UPI0023A27E35|nr:hypothetical protein L3040_004974 [Drepanopeziza brunnea f. sp. 'multigermtubi']